MLNTLRELLIDQVQDLYDAEHRIIDALPRMAGAARANGLKSALVRHRKETQLHLDRLDQVFGLLGETPRGKTCRAMRGMVEEGDEALAEDANPAVRDASILAAAQRMEHYEIAGYGTVLSYAKILKQHDIVGLFEQTLSEEKLADGALSELADREVNVNAA